MNEELKKLFEGMELSEDFKTKFSEVYEARIAEEKEAIKEEAETAAEEKYSAISEDYAEYVVSEMETKTDEYIQNELIPVVERYIDYAAKEFVNENKPEIQAKTKVELADKLITGFTGLAESYNVKVPEGQEDAVAKLEEKLKEADKRLDAALAESEKLQETIVESKKDSLIGSIVEGMTETKKERFSESAKKIKFIDESQFKDALEELKESYTPSKPDNEDDLDKIDEGNRIDEETDPYLDSLKL